jgi:hypothetical protein
MINICPGELPSFRIHINRTIVCMVNSRRKPTAAPFVAVKSEKRYFSMSNQIEKNKQSILLLLNFCTAHIYNLLKIHYVAAGLLY